MIDNRLSFGTPYHPAFGEPEWPRKQTIREAAKRDPVGDDTRLRIIVIDDEVLIAETVVEILKHEGFEATAAPNGHAAIDLAKSWSPDVVLSDVIMPGINGIETGIKIREMIPRCKVILFSGQAATVDLLERAREHGHSFEILAKPIKPEKLISVIRDTANSD